MELSELKEENELTKSLPAYIRQYADFFEFLKMLSNYILKSVKHAEKILSLLDFNNSNGDVLIKIAKKVGVSYDGVYRETDKSAYETALKIGITGMQTKRLSDGSLYSIQKSLTSTLAKEIKIVAIRDNMDMSVNIELEGNISDYNKSIIEDYILPRTTGVFFDVLYIPYSENIFAYDKNELLVKDEETNDFIRAVDASGNEVDEFVLFEYKNGTYEPITDENGTYYYKGNKVKTAKTGQGGWNLGDWAPKSSTN